MVSVFGLFLFYNCLSLQYQVAFALTKVPIDCHLICKLRENFKFKFFKKKKGGGGGER